jgi:DNA invertase Pin-like site-specific DNA recombinase
LAEGQRLVAYERVSTARQGASGLGLEAQRKVIEDFAFSRSVEVLARFPVAKFERWRECS